MNMKIARSIFFAALVTISLNVFAEASPALATTSGSQTATASPATTAASAQTATAATDTVKPKETETLLKTKETEIPVRLDSDRKADGSGSALFKVLMSLSVIGILGCAAFFWIRKYAKPGNKSQATQIKVLTQHYLGPKKSLAIIRVAGESILVGVTDHNISLIKELSLLDEDIPEATPKTFKTVFSMGGNDFAGETTEASAEAEQDAAEKDEFSISGIKDFVSSKLKNMRSFE
jgi:flagellar protein FliO/FliZ